MLDQTLSIIRKFIPEGIYKFFQPIYHYKMALLSALLYRFPSDTIYVIGVTGTKGKSTTVEIINVILEEAGYKTALSNTIRYKIGAESTPNKFKMSMPGRFFVQRFLRKAVQAKCDYVILEMTSQGTLQYRQKFIQLNALVFTNLSPEHIESHGSYEKYVQAKLEIAKQLSKSPKRPRILIVNSDDKEAGKFLAFDAEIKKSYSLKDETIPSPLLGDFNKYNVLAGATLASVLHVDESIIKKAIANFKEVPGRVQFIKCGQDFDVVVDYAHTTDSLEKLYKVFKKDGSKNGHENHTPKNICILGGTGGGRDTWKRKEMGHIADTYCEEIILTNEDPYDENPDQIVAHVAEGIKNKNPKIIMGRREAIAYAIRLAKSGDSILITGKGTDPYIMGPNGTKTPWSDAEVAKGELEKIFKK